MDDTHLFPVKQGSRGHPSARTRTGVKQTTVGHSFSTVWVAVILYTGFDRRTGDARGRAPDRLDKGTRCLFWAVGAGLRSRSQLSLYLAADNSIVLYKFGRNAKRFEMDLVLLAWPRRMQSPISAFNKKYN